MGRASTTKVCSGCGQSFLATSQNPKKKFCSLKCSSPKAPRVQTLCLNPNCGEKFESREKERRKYCSRSCAASTNNVKFPKKISSRSRTRVCPECGNGKSPDAQWCSVCYVKARKDQKIQHWLDGTWAGGTALGVSNIVREYLLESVNYKCSNCQFNTPHPLDGRTILEVDHIDGNGENHSPTNLRVLCPNCHALTSTYRGRNIGQGRKVYYQRVAR